MKKKLKKNKLNNNNLNIVIVYNLMNLYTLPENQKLIWDTISKVASFQQMRQSNPNKSEEWFRSIIQMYYNKSETTVFDKKTLTTLNKETIRYMLQDLKQSTQSQRQPEPLSFQNSYDNNSISGSSFSTNYSTLETNTNETRNFILEEKHAKLNNDFQLRQQEYSSLIEKPKQPEIDFRESTTEDKPIENMDELIKRQMAEREYDVQNIAKKKDDIDENIPIETVSLEPEKKVTFKEDNTENYDDKIDHINKRIDDFIKEFSEKIESIQNDIKNIKSEQKILIENTGIRNAEKIISRLRKVDKTPEKEDSIIQEINQ